MGLKGSIRNLSTGIGAAITIDTLEAENVDVDSATIRGEITELTNFGEDAEVFFEWGEITQGLPNTTDIQLQDTVGVFTEDLTNLSEDTTHEFQAFGSVRDVSDDGVVLTFETGAAIPDSGDLQTRYDASEQAEEDDESVTVLIDQVNNWDLTANGSPTLENDRQNGLPLINYDGASDSHEGDIFGSETEGPIHIFMAGKLDSTQSSDSLRLLSGDNDGSEERFTFSEDSSTSNWEIQTDSQVQGSSTDTDFHIFSILFTDSGEDDHLRIDGDFDIQTDLGAMPVTKEFGIGFDAGDDAREIDMSMGEVLVYPMDKTDSEEKIEEYLADKWGVSLD